MRRVPDNDPTVVFVHNLLQHPSELRSRGQGFRGSRSLGLPGKDKIRDREKGGEGQGTGRERKKKGSIPWMTLVSTLTLG